MNTNSTIFTIGHSNVLVSHLMDLLKQFEIEVLVDVRSSPYSQYSQQFNRDQLEASLKENGIEYKFAGEYLGGRPKDPTCYKNGQVPDGKADYLHLVDYPIVMTKDWFQKGINRLIEISENKKVVVMCSEEDPAICHRHHLIGRYLLEQGREVLHIRGNGKITKAQQIQNLNNEPPAEQLSMF